MKKITLLLTFLLSLNTAFASFAESSIVETESGEKLIQSIQRGDSVVTLMEGSTKENMKYNLHIMDFVDSGDANTMVLIQYGEKKLIVTHDQPFFQTSGKFIKAKDLVPGVNQLLSAKGEAIDIDNVIVGQFSGKVYSIANSQRSDIFGNTIVVNGIVVGSFAIEIGLD